jgi:SAM-dependent methyltransferase
MLDAATGAGHTAFIFSPHVARVVATDLTKPMLQQTTALADEKHLKNIDVTAADAVTCRLALHHFPNPSLAIAEFRRVLKPNGVLALTDNITVEDTTAAAYYNAYEKLRDPSHHRVYTLQELTDLLTTGGFIVQASRKLTKELEFEAWADRQHVSNADKHVLVDKMRHLPDTLRELFQPRWENDTMYFSLWEAVLVSRLVSTKDRVAPRGQQSRLPLNQIPDRV